jgi:hypothetical protein
MRQRPAMSGPVIPGIAREVLLPYRAVGRCRYVLSSWPFLIRCLLNQADRQKLLTMMGCAPTVCVV